MDAQYVQLNEMILLEAQNVQLNVHNVYIYIYNTQVSELLCIWIFFKFMLY